MLTSLGWLLALLLAATMSCVSLGAPNWLLVLFAVLSVITVALYLTAYVYFMLHAPDALRSESFSLGKMAIERGIIGDDLAGIVEVDPARRITALTADKSGAIE